MPAYKNENRGSWYVTFYFTDWTGTRKKKKKEGFRTKKEALAYEREFLSKKNAGPDMIFSTLVDIYLEDCLTRLKPTTYRTKHVLITTKLLPYFGQLKVNDIEPSAIRKWQNELINSEKNYSPTYLKIINNQLTAIFNFGMKYYKLTTNPARVAGSMGKKKADSMQFWTLDEFNSFLAVIDGNKMMKMIFELLFWTGIRSGELLALTYSDFDFENNLLSISKTYARVYREDIIQEPKTPKSKRNITLPEFLCQKIKDYYRIAPVNNEHDRLFPILRTTIYPHLYKYAEKANIKRIRTHDLRHSHASLLIEMGFSPLLISERLGHESIETTLQTYSHLYPNKHTEVSDQLQQLNASKLNSN